MERFIIAIVILLTLTANNSMADSLKDKNAIRSFADSIMDDFHVPVPALFRTPVKRDNQLRVVSKQDGAREIMGGSVQTAAVVGQGIIFQVLGWQVGQHLFNGSEVLLLDKINQIFILKRMTR